MKSRIVFLTIVSMISVVSVAVWAQAPGRMGGPGRPFEPMRMHPVLRALDADGDGEFSAEETSGASEALKKLDKDGDGKISGAELRPPLPRGGPGGPRPMGSFRPGDRGPGGRGEASMEAAPRAKDAAEAQTLKTIQQIVESQGWRSNVPDTDGRLLRLLAEAIDAKNVVEVGTSNGISAIWIAQALSKTGGKLTTLEIDPETAELARKNLAAAGAADRVTVVVGDAHQTVSKLEGPIDMVFIDADKQGYLDYFQKLLPLLRPGGLITAHNMTPGMADPDFLKAITTNPDVETLFYTQGGGVSITLKKR